MTAHAEHLEHAHHHQFEDLDQQNECYTVGMWSFLVTEIMFFGALFLALFVYRSKYGLAFHDAHTHLSIPLGFINTLILLTSSLSMALAVRWAQLGLNKPANRRMVLALLGVTLLCAFGFLVVKTVEYSAKFEHHLVPGPTFKYEQTAEGGHTPIKLTTQSHQSNSLEAVQLFFGLYFGMTGLHAIHVIIGIIIMGILAILILKKSPLTDDFMVIEMAGLYWHFVDIVWIFLYPILYLIG